MIKGEKTILFPFELVDIEFFVELLKINAGKLLAHNFENLNDAQIELMVVREIEQGKLKIWTVVTKQGQRYRKMGFIFLTDISDYKATMYGMLDKQFLKNLDQEMKNKYTYSEDAVRAFTRYCLNGEGYERIEVAISRDNKLSLQLCIKCGFKKEGVLRKYIKYGDKLRDTIVMSMIKKDLEKKGGK